MDGNAYMIKQDEEFAQYEAKCKRCGRCCGAFSAEPCAKLAKDESDRYYCLDYENRFGNQSTVTGKCFTCVPIRDVFKEGLPYEDCGYLI